MPIDRLSDEEGRLGALHRYGLPRAGEGEAIDRIVKIALAATGAPIAGVSVVGRDTQSFLAVRGLPTTPIANHQSLCALAIVDSRPLIVEDTQAVESTARLDLVTGERGVRSYLGVPVVSDDGYNLGTVFVMDTQPRHFSEQDVTILVNLSRLVSAQLASRHPDDFDFVTGALTRRRFQTLVEREFDRATRYERPASLVFIDIDNFRKVNAGMGAAMADEVLKAVSNRCMEVLRSTDCFGRIGGEEFGMLLPETLAYESSQCAERLREIVSNLRFRTETGVTAITASFGIAPLNESIKASTQWFARADVALYVAKQSGGNCVAFAPPVDEALPLVHDELSGFEDTLPKLH